MDFKEANIRTDLTFDNFKVGESNKKAYEAALTCSALNGNQHNLLWIYADTGLGCTHLLHAIANQLLSKQQNIKVKKIHAQAFVTNYQHAIFKNELTKFKDCYGKFDCLLLDDMQYLLCFGYAHRNEQEQLIDILLELSLRKTLTVFTADRSFLQLEESKLKCLLKSSNQVKITKPDVALKTQIVNQYALKKGYKLSGDVLKFIAQQKSINIRALEGQVAMIMNEVNNTKEILNLSLVKKCFKKWYKRFY